MRNKKLVTDLVLDGLFIGIIAVMGFVPNLGYIRLGPISATILPIPVILGGAFLGWKRGLLYGTAFGVTSYLVAITLAAGTDSLFANPILSIAPRMVFGALTGLLAGVFLNPKYQNKTRRILAIPFGALLTLIHSVLVLGTMFLIYPAQIAAISLALLFVVLAEIGVAMFLTPLLYFALEKPFAARDLKYSPVEEIESEFKAIVAPYFTRALETLINFVNIDSVYDAKTINEKMPYGKGVAQALNFVESLAIKDGLQVKNIDGRAIEIYFGDATKPNIGVFAHADVVPATGTWKSEPFKAEIREGRLYARGTSDDKGPGIAAYYAIKALFDHGYIKDYSVRLVIGGDEERGSSCMRYYFHDYKAPAPQYGFTPDAEFPLIYGEKAITNFNATKILPLGPIIHIKGGEAANSVIDKVLITLPLDEGLLKELDDANVSYSVSKEMVNMTLIIFGKSAHGSLPQLGINAGVLAFKYLGDYYKIKHLQLLAEKFSDPSGKTMDAYLSTPLLGESTYNIGLLSYEEGVLTFTCNFRYPEDVDLTPHLKQLGKTLKMDLKVKSTSKHLLFDPESDFIKTLMDAYTDETGDNGSKPLAIGGGTYAKECPNTVAFGSAFAGRSGDIHSPDEHILIEDFNAQMAIYARAIHYLGTRLCA